MSLFAAGATNSLVEFKAGKCVKEGNMVRPDPRKGLIYITRDEEQELTRFCWKDRSTNTVEDDLIIFPGDTEFIKVEQSSGRVFLLKFKTSEQRLFFWSQEPKEEADKELQAKINQVLNEGLEMDVDMKDEPPAKKPKPSSEEKEGSTFVPRNVPQPAASDPSDVQRRLIELLSQTTSRQTQQRSSDLDFASVFKPENLAPVLSDKKSLEELYTFLPEGFEHSRSEVESIIASPQFAQSLRSLTAALRSGQAFPLYAQLGLKHPSNSIGVRAFLQAILDSVNEQKKNEMQE